MPSSTLAATTQPHEDAHISKNGTGRPSNQPSSKSFFRPKRSAKPPVNKLAVAFTKPKATMKLSTALVAAMPNSASAS